MVDREFNLGTANSCVCARARTCVCVWWVGESFVHFV